MELIPENSSVYLYQGDYLLPDQRYDFVKRGIDPTQLHGYSDIGVLIRLYGLEDPAALADHIFYLLGQWQLSGTDIVKVQLDHDSPSNNLLGYAQFVQELKTRLDQYQEPISLSTTGLVTWLKDNPEDLEALAKSTDYIAFQLYSQFHPFDTVEDYFPAIGDIQYPYRIGVTTSDQFTNLTYPKNENYHGKFVFLNVL